MKHFRILLPLLILALILSGCGNPSREAYTYVYSTFSGGKILHVDPESGTITEGQDVYHYEVDERGSMTSYVINYPNGAIYHWSETQHGGAGGGNEHYDEERYIPGNILLDAIRENQPREKTGYAAVGILLIGLGALNFFLPELGFWLRYGWAVENAEPSEAYIILTKTGGVLAAVVGLIWCFI